MARPWTTAELGVLQHYGDTEAARRTGRTVAAVARKRRLLADPRQARVAAATSRRLRRDYEASSRQFAWNRGQPWSDSELQRVQDWKGDSLELARLLGRTYSSVVQRRYLLRQKLDS